jgi:hypothetical protein
MTGTHSPVAVPQASQTTQATLAGAVQGLSTDTTAGALFAATFALAFLASIGLALFVAYRTYRGYRRSGERRLLLFSVGLLCIVLLSKLTFVVVTTAFDAPDGVAGALSTTWRIVGGLLMLSAIYERD